ncbi:SGNH/GDSL hydrolase family protein [Ekhidna sp. To15]|uniref:SGNH/GDSL hydrolase family protein n=1 Tax=Ekhidna sp. To15 TaxID=3395267 RepID=UPI003F5200D5
MTKASAKSIWKKIGYVFYLLIFTLIAFELIARFYLGQVLQKSSDKKFQFNSYRIFEHVPGFTEGDENGEWIKINKQGFRESEDYPKEKPSNTYRIFLLGGSAAHGISSAAPYPIRHIYPDETIDSFLEGILNERSDSLNYEIINAAVTGYQVFQHTAYLLSELLDYDPDMIIFFDGANDHYANNPEHNFYMDNRYQFWKNRLQEPSIGGQLDYFAYWMADYSALFRGYFAWKLQHDAIRNNTKIDMKNTINKVDKETVVENHKKAANKGYLRSVKTNLMILEASGVDAIVCLQPMLVLRDENLLSGAETSFLHEDKNVKWLYPVVKEELGNLMDEFKVNFVDLNPIFNNPDYKSNQLFIDYCHLSPEGGKVVADTLSAYFK